MNNYIRSIGKIIFVSLLFSLMLLQSSPAQNESREITWSAIPYAPMPFGKAAGGVIGDYLYVFGGRPHTDLALAYSLNDETWMETTPPDHRVSDAAYCVANEALYVFSGLGAGNFAEKFVPDGSGNGTWYPIARPPERIRRDGITCCWDGGDFIYSNNSDKSNNPDGYFARYNIADDSWEMLEPAPHPRRYAGMASVNGSIYLIGGLGGNDDDTHVCQVFVEADSSWGVIAPHPDPLTYTNSTVISDGARIWTVGHGGGFGNFPASAHVHYYDPTNDSWTAETDLPVERGFALVAFQSSTSRIIQVGGSTGNGMRFVSDGRIGETTPLEPGILTGIVVDNWYSNPVFEVEVSVFDYNSNLIGKDTTDEYGSYSFILDPGVYSALYTKFSYLDSTITGIGINPDDTTEVDVVLTFQSQCDYMTGDVNGSWSYNGLDVTYLIGYFKGGPGPIYCYCECTPGDWWFVCCDVNGDCECNGLDVVRAVWFFKGGPEPTPCPDCPPSNPITEKGPQK